ncbi:hypothetical protein [Halomonas sp. NCCP-2165]|nr:hypothetical protein [Halomonas sp. NCCP-2165]GKW47931.1 hypothetical protein NCCP2165_01460 [Halomonas sp. NCCP-2165]
MTIKPTLAALLIAAIPMAAQAGQATALAMQLSEPLSAVQQADTHSISGDGAVRDIASAYEHADQSTAMAESRARLNTRYRDSEVNSAKLTSAGLQLARNATK